jgi:hypothetical protein
MTAMRMGLVARGGTGIVLVAAWAVGGSRLWRTSVPSSLKTGGLDVHRYFSTHQLAEAHHFSLYLQLDWLLGTIATVAALVVLVYRAPGFAGKIGLGPIGSGVIVGMRYRASPGRVSGRFLIPSRVWYFDQESFTASTNRAMNCVDMLTRVTTTPGISPASDSKSTRPKVSVNS